MSKYCLLVWHKKLKGSVVFKDGSPFFSSKCETKFYKKEMQKMYKNAKYRLVNVKELKKAFKAAKEVK